MQRLLQRHKALRCLTWLPLLVAEAAEADSSRGYQSSTGQASIAGRLDLQHRVAMQDEVGAAELLHDTSKRLGEGREVAGLYRYDG